MSAAEQAPLLLFPRFLQKRAAGGASQFPLDFFVEILYNTMKAYNRGDLAAYRHTRILSKGGITV